MSTQNVTSLSSHCHNRTMTYRTCACITWKRPPKISWYKLTDTFLKVEQRKGTIPVWQSGGGGGETLPIAMNPCASSCAAILLNTLCFEPIYPLCAEGFTIPIREHRKGRSHYRLKRFWMPPNMICVGTWCFEKWVLVAFVSFLYKILYFMRPLVFPKDFYLP